VTHLSDLQTWEHGIDVGKSPHHHYDVSVFVGSQDGLTKAFEMLLDPAKDELFIENPTYSGALAFLQPFGIKMTPVATDEFGIKPESFRAALDKSTGPKRRVLYTIPVAQNPSGSTLSNDRREEIYNIAAEHDMIIMEDDPYFYVHPQRDSVKSFLSLDTDGRVIRFDSLSKLISSGIRIGFATGPPKLIERLSFHTQATNLHNSGVSQIMVTKLLDHWGKRGFDEHANKVAAFYCRRRDVLLAAAERHLTGLATWSAPEAGMFLWLKLNGINDTKSLIEDKAAAANVLFVPGQSFDPLDKPSPYVRASFSTASDEDMDVAMDRLAALISNEAALAA
jgi:kynurenine/2-aminoadipate aminotransferase